jgi:hypothetical protein
MSNDEAHPSQGEEEQFGVHEACINKEAFFFLEQLRQVYYDYAHY